MVTHIMRYLNPVQASGAAAVSVAALFVVLQAEPVFAANDPTLEASSGCEAGCLARSLEVSGAEQAQALGQLLKMPLTRTKATSRKVLLFGPKDDRRHADQTIEELMMSRAIGRLRSNIRVQKKQADGTWQGVRVDVESTAAMVSPCHVLAAAHAVYGSGESIPLEDEYRDAKHKMTFVASDGRTVSGYPVYVGWYDRLGRGRDLALIELDRCIGVETGWFAIRPPKESCEEEASGDRTAALFAFHADKPDRRLYRSDGTLTERRCDNDYFDGEWRVWKSDIDTYPGSSGGPGFEIGPGGKIDRTGPGGVPVLAVINSAGQKPRLEPDKDYRALHGFSPSHSYNLFADVSSSYPEFAAQIERALEQYADAPNFQEARYLAQAQKNALARPANNKRSEVSPSQQAL